MTNQIIDPQISRQFVAPRIMSAEQPSLLSSLFENVRDILFPQKLPPLKVTSKPVAVRDIWEKKDPKKAAAYSLTVHGLMIGSIIALTIFGAKTVTEKKVNVITLISPSLDTPMPILPQKGPTMGGGGGGGAREKMQAPQGKAPKLELKEQITPPAIVVKNDAPKLPVEASVMVPNNVRLPNSNLPTIGVPLSKVVGPPSNGTGSGGGIGEGAGGGLGVGTGRGVGPGSGAGYGGGPLRVGGGVSAPRPIETPDPEYSEEARKAKYQGVVVLWLVVGPDGRPHDMKVQRSLGMGLDQKAMEAVRRWKFEPATMNGKPVTVGISVEVNFRLY